MKSLDRLMEFVEEDAVLAEMVEDVNDEVSERFLELPIDADGVPIHLGDYLKSEEYDGRQFPCRGLNVEVCNSGKRWTVCLSYDSYSGTSEYTPANRCRHVKPRTIEDVLRDFAKEVNVRQSDFISIDGENAYLLAAINETADEIRGMMV